MRSRGSRWRGIPALRYQGDLAAVAEIEARYTFAERWAALVFGGGGYIKEDAPIFETEDDIRAGGFGVRYNVFKQHGVWAGLDFAWGPEDFAWYIQVGHPW